MKNSDWYSVMAGFVSLGVVLIGGVAYLEEAPAGNASASSRSAAAVDHLYLTISFNPYSGYDQYFPANFTVPSHTLVVFTITNYDNGTNHVASVLTAVSGTVGGIETISMGNTMAATPVSNVPPDGIAHTFSVMSLGLNAPIPSAPNQTTPSITSFGVYFNQTGDVNWMCEAPCDPVSMMMPGYMMGTISVE